MMNRKIYLIDKKFQMSMISKVVLLIICSIFISGVISYFVTVHFEKLNDFQLYGTTGGNLNTMIMVSSLFLVKPVIVKSLVLGGGLGTLIAIVLFIFYSHRIAGPMYHLEKHIEMMIRGNYEEDLKFRKKDEFKQLADLINQLQDKLKDKKR